MRRRWKIAITAGAAGVAGVVAFAVHQDTARELERRRAYVKEMSKTFDNPGEIMLDGPDDNMLIIGGKDCEQRLPLFASDGRAQRVGIVAVKCPGDEWTTVHAP
jgi:hypothetical protein